MIPKVIHYCWFGRGEKSALIKNCIASWKKYLDDYEIIEWNEDNFNIYCNQYVKEAYDNKKYAFVADYARLKVLYDLGGVYLDSDVEVVRPLNEEFLKHQGFSGFESDKNVPTGIMGCEKGYGLFGEFLNYYQNKHFINEDGSFNDITNVFIITEELERRGLKRNNTFQIIDGFALYPKEYFCPLEDATGKMNKTNNTYTIHWFAKSWWEKRDVKKYKRAKLFYKLLGKNMVECLSGLKHKLFDKNGRRSG